MRHALLTATLVLSLAAPALAKAPTRIVDVTRTPSSTTYKLSGGASKTAARVVAQGASQLGLNVHVGFRNPITRSVSIRVQAVPGEEKSLKSLHQELSDLVHQGDEQYRHDHFSY